MSNTVYVTLARQELLRAEMDVVAQNIANASTTAYKGERKLFREQLFQSADGSSISYVVDAGAKRDNTQGRIERTGNDLDIAINGEGYFSINHPDGTKYSRQGHFVLDAKGTVVTSGGLPVLDASGRSIVIPKTASRVIIGHDGTVATDKGPLTKLQLVKFEKEDELARQGEGLFAYAGSEPPEPLPPDETDLQQGALEASNVSTIIEMTRMIEIVRNYQSSQKMMETDTELQRKSIQDITAVK